MLNKRTRCFASILFAVLFAGTAQADPLTITSGFFTGTTTGVDRTWVLNIAAGPNFSVQATGDGFIPGAGFNLTPGSSLTIIGAAGGEGSRGTLFLDGVTYNTMFVMPHLQFSPTTLVVPDLAPGETRTFNLPFSMTGSVELYNSELTSPRYTGQTFIDFAGSGTGIFTLSRNNTGILLSGVSYRFEDPTAVPEPATIVLLSTGLAGAIGAARKRRRVKNQG